MKKRICFFAVACLALLTVAGADAVNFKITGYRAREHVKVLAGDDMKGRMTGTPEMIRATEYFADQMKKLRIEPIGDAGTYFQHLSVPIVRNTPPNTFEITGQGPMKYKTNFCALQYSGAGKVTGEVVFVGYGISDPAKGLDEYDRLDVKGKIVMAIRCGPNEDESWGADNYIGYKSKTAREKGAVGFILVARQPKEGSTAPLPGTIQAQYYCSDLPAICVSSTVADKILAGTGKTTRQLQKQIDTTGKPAGAATGVTAMIEVHGVYDPQSPTQNALGILRGCDPRLKDEYIIISAHIDHVGEEPDGEIYNGADDDASGVGAMLEIMEAMTKNHVKPKRSIVFAAWAGEELGLIGSMYWIDHPTVPLDKVVCNLHLDMVGRGEAKATAYGAKSFTAFWAQLMAAPGMQRDGIRPAPGGGGSDHAAFAAKRIPAIMTFAGGPHPDYHEVSDTWDKIQPEVLAFCSQFVYDAALAVANDPAFSPPAHADVKAPVENIEAGK